MGASFNFADVSFEHKASHAVSTDSTACPDTAVGHLSAFSLPGDEVAAVAGSTAEIVVAFAVGHFAMVSTENEWLVALFAGTFGGLGLAAENGVGHAGVVNEAVAWNAFVADFGSAESGVIQTVFNSLDTVSIFQIEPFVAVQAGSFCVLGQAPDDSFLYAFGIFQEEATFALFAVT